MSGEAVTPAAAETPTPEEAARVARLDRLEQRLATIETKVCERLADELAAVSFHLDAAQKRVMAWEARLRSEPASAAEVQR